MVIFMNNSYVLIITGDQMGNLSNQFHKLIVSAGSDHTFLLEEFMLDHKIDYPYWDYCFSHDAVKLAVLGNIVILIGSIFHILAFPEMITDYQISILEDIHSLFNNDDSYFSIMNISKDLDKFVYEGLSSSICKENYDRLVFEKHEKWKNRDRVLKK